MLFYALYCKMFDVNPLFFFYKGHGFRRIQWGACNCHRKARGTLPPKAGTKALITNPSIPSSTVPDLMGPSKPVPEFLIQKVPVSTLLSMPKVISKAFLFFIPALI